MLRSRKWAMNFAVRLMPADGNFVIFFSSLGFFFTVFMPILSSVQGPFGEKFWEMNSSSGFVNW